MDQKLPIRVIEIKVVDMVHAGFIMVKLNLLFSSVDYSGLCFTKRPQGLYSEYSAQSVSTGQTCSCEESSLTV